MYVRQSHSEMENIVKDALDRRKSKALGPVIYSPFTMRSTAVVARSGRPHSIARERLQDATMRSERSTQAIAGGNDEVGRTADPPSS